VLLEREIDLGLADEHLDGVRAGEGGILVLEGPPGIGKTSLLAVVAEHARARGFEVLHARASQLDHGFSFGVARQLLERRVGAAGAAERRALLAGTARDGLAPLAMAGEQVEGDGGLRSLHGLYWLVANLAGRGPLALCVDDAQWADRSSLRWLAYTAQRLAGLPLALILGTRPTEPGAEQDLLDALALDDRAQRLRLMPLSTTAIGVLVGSSLPGEVAPEFETACHHSTGGNPLLMVELLRELAAEGATPTAARARQLEGFGVEAVTRNVRRRLRALGPQAEAVARAVAVVGDGATVVEVAALCEIDEPAVRTAATALAATGVLLADARLAFVHPLVRAAVYDDLAPVQRAALHRQVAGLRDGASDPERIAVHLLHAEPRADPRAVEILRAAAADAIVRGAPDAAATFLQRALVEPPEAGAPRAAVLVDLGHAEALGRTGDFEGHLNEAIAELGDTERAAAVALSLGRAQSSLGNWSAAFEVTERALMTVDPQSPMGVLLEGELLMTAHGFANLRPKVADRVDGYLARLERGEQVDAVMQGALCLWLLCHHPPGQRAVEAAKIALADERLAASKMATLILPAIGWTLLGTGHIAQAGRIFDAAVAESRRRGDLLKLGWGSSLRSDVSFRQGDVVKAEGEARVGWDLATDDGRSVPTPVGQLAAAGIYVNVLVARGELVEAQRCVDCLPASLPDRSELFLPARAELRLAQGRFHEAIADLRATGELLADEFFKPIQNWRARLAVALAGSGAREEAGALAAVELEQARRWDVAPAIGVALTAAGVVEGGSAGVGMLEEAVTILAETEARLDHALALIELGALLRRSGSPAAARAPLRVGLDLAARGGATAYADRAHAELVAAGARPRRDRRLLTGPESLTAGEYRVAALATEGLTNREIAQRLYVTQAAVQFHLRNTFRKLDIGARGELAAVLDPPAGTAETYSGVASDKPSRRT
jgi:DNA-binding CsgD family transcriptional regulator